MAKILFLGQGSRVHFFELVQELSMIDGKVYYFMRLFSRKVYFCRLEFNGKVYVKKKDSNGNR